MWADPRTYLAATGTVIGAAGFLWGILSFHWNRRESRLDALSKVLQPMVRAAQHLHEANDLRRKSEYLKRSFPPGEKTAEALQRVNDFIAQYGDVLDKATEQFRLAESEFHSRSFRFPDKICRLIQAAQSSLSELGCCVNEGKFDKADLQFVKFRDDYGAVLKAGRGLRLADPFESLRKRWSPKPKELPLSEYEITEKQMSATMDLVYRRATTQASNTFAVHAPKKLLDNPQLAQADTLVKELENSVFTVVFQDGAHRMLTLVELVVFVYNLITLSVQMQEVHRVATALSSPPSHGSVSLQFRIPDLMRPEMVKFLLSKVEFSSVPSDTPGQSEVA